MRRVVSSRKNKSQQRDRLRSVFRQLINERRQRLLLVIRVTLTNNRRRMISTQLRRRVRQTVALRTSLLINTINNSSVRLNNVRLMTILLVSPTHSHLRSLKVIRKVSVIPSAAIIAIQQRMTAIIRTLRNRTRIVADKIR